MHLKFGNEYNSADLTDPLNKKEKQNLGDDQKIYRFADTDH